MLLLFILTTQLRDKLPSVRVALNKIVWALRRLDGQVYCYHDAKNKLGILPGSRVIDPKIIVSAHCDLIIGLCLLEGCLPIEHLNPALHHLVHFAQYTKTHGCLRALWMMYFERSVSCSVIWWWSGFQFTLTLLFQILYVFISVHVVCRYNKHIKNLVRDPSHPEAHLANSVVSDVSSRYMNLVMGSEYDMYSDPHHLCVLSSLDRKFSGCTQREVAQLRMIQTDVDFDVMSISAYKVYVSYLILIS